MPQNVKSAAFDRLRGSRRPIAIGLVLLGLTGAPGCRHVGNLLFPPLPDSDARTQSRVELRVLQASDFEARNRGVERALNSLSVQPETIRELAEMFAAERERGAEPSEEARLQLQRAYGELALVQRTLSDLDGQLLAFRPRNVGEDHAAHARARSDFYACTGLVDPYASHPALDAFAPTSVVTGTSPSLPGASTPGLEATGLLVGASRYTARHGALANGVLYRRARSGRAQIQQEARILELRCSFERGGQEHLALRLLYRIDFDATQQLFRLSPVYLRLDATTVKVGGLQTRSARGAWGWLWPWMWAHALWGAFDDGLYAVDLEAQDEIDAVVSGNDDERDGRRLGAVRFHLGRVHARHLPFEQSCRNAAGGLRSLPSPSLPIPRTTNETMALPLDVRVTLAERNRFGHGLASVGGVFARDEAELSPDLPLTLGFDVPRGLTSDPGPPPPAEPGHP